MIINIIFEKWWAVVVWNGSIWTWVMGARINNEPFCFKVWDDNQQKESLSIIYKSHIQNYS